MKKRWNPVGTWRNVIFLRLRIWLETFNKRKLSEKRSVPKLPLSHAAKKTVTDIPTRRLFRTAFCRQEAIFIGTANLVQSLYLQMGRP